VVKVEEAKTPEERDRRQTQVKRDRGRAEARTPEERDKRQTQVKRDRGRVVVR
jgi:hypothetical protein